MGTGELHWVFNPASNCVGHGLHIQSRDHYRVTLGEEEGKKKKKKLNEAVFCGVFLVCLCIVLVSNIVYIFCDFSPVIFKCVLCLTELL